MTEPTPKPKLGGHGLSMHVEQEMPAVGMTDAKLERIKKRIRREINVAWTTSFWVALALAIVAVGGSLVITVQSATLSTNRTGELEVAYWACFAVGVILIGVHLRTSTDAKDRAEDVIDELETDLVRVSPHDT
jgi:hypothetical protein